MRVLSWNVRGCNEILKIKEIRELCSKHHIQVVALLETRVRKHKREGVMRRIGDNWN